MNEALVNGVMDALDKYEAKIGTNGCEYCRMEPNGDIPEDREDLINVKAGKVFDSDVYVSVVIVRNKMNLIGGNNFCKEIKINYCPMCGRKL